MSVSWMVLLADGRVSGPYSEAQVRSGLRLGKIDDTMRVRQGDSGWIRVSKVRSLFDQLNSNGYFIRYGTELLGPYTQDRLDAIRKDLPNHYWIRKGATGEWESINRRPAPAQARQPILFPQPPERTVPTIPVETSSRLPASPRPTKPAVPAAPVMKLRSNSWKDSVVGVFDRVETMILGDPLTN